TLHYNEGIGASFINVKQYLKWAKNAEVTVHEEIFFYVSLWNKPTQLSQNSAPKQNRANALHEKIKQIYKNDPKQSTRSIWNILKKMSAEGDEIIQEVSSWTDPEAKIYWRSHRKKERTLKRESFENFISDLKNPASD